MYYHYTSLETFLKILQGIEIVDEKPVLHLHATRVDKVNDPTEMSMDKCTLLKLIKNYEEKNDVSHDNCIAKKIETFPQERFEELMKLEKYETPPYIICFSKRKDYLPMWSLYGEKHHGVCLCFADDIIDTVDAEHKELNILCGDVAYRRFEKSRTINLVLELYYTNFASFSNDDLETTISNFLTGILPFIKSSSYVYEHEFRICVYNFVKERIGILGDELCMYDNTNYYINLNIPVSSLKCMILGKNVPFEISRLLFETYFKAHGYQINIEQSQIPYQ